MIEVRNLTKRYGGNLAVDHLSFSVEKGEIYGFLGPNGAGKSTTMNILAGYLAATEGEVRINGLDILRDAKKAKAMVGYLPEVPPLYLDMTVSEFLTFAAELKGIGKAERREAVEMVQETMQITDVSQRLIKNLSKGYRQRVGFAQALLGLPEVLILDEPTAGLDPKQIMEIRDLIRQLGENHTILLSSHILSEVSAVCDKIMIISGGKLVACDTPDKLTAMMQPVTKLRIAVKADAASADAVLSAIDGLDSYEIAQGSEEGVLDIEAQYENGRDLRDEIAMAFAEAKCLVVGLTEENASLEDVFLELIQADEKTPDELIAETESDGIDGIVGDNLEETEFVGDGETGETDDVGSADDFIGNDAGEDEYNRPERVNRDVETISEDAGQLLEKTKNGADRELTGGAEGNRKSGETYRKSAPQSMAADDGEEAGHESDI